MKLYFIRHGESKLNAVGVHQHAEVELSYSGIQQAQNVANRFVNIPIDTILSSPYTRTKQTAEEINKIIKKEVIYTDFLREIKRPTEIEGLKINDPEALRIKQLIKEYRGNVDWHYSDEDNFHDLKKRAQGFIQYLETTSGNHVLAVTHGLILRVIICTMMLGEDFDTEYFEAFEKFFMTTNTGITMCEKDNDKWKLLAWNDYTHLE